MLISRVFAATPMGETTISAGVFDLIWDSGPIVKFVLLILAIFSLVSWVIIFLKYFSINKSRKTTEEFLKHFYSCENLDSMCQLATEYPDSPVASIFHASYQEMQKLADNKSDFKIDIENIGRAVNKAHFLETGKLEDYISFLATTASATPFIGLFGTVWGIMNSFQAIGAAGSANLATVAPGISEALIATAIGLFAAIPAVIFYNFFLNRIKQLNLEMKNFKADLLNIIKRNF